MWGVIRRFERYTFLIVLEIHNDHKSTIRESPRPLYGNCRLNCREIGLVVEIDGNSHDTKAACNKRRQQYLENLGLRIFRITDIDVKKNLKQVMTDLERFIVNENVETEPQPVSGCGLL
jgi:hypothetical protein